ncbi:N-acetyl-gamma-glutamyl-phosphate reductase [Alicyclobacillus tolerans]|uniref:N-acetyl-gamma-glutamyl-phosphate reductase n=1 Tax=Alicyclobacillus tolerans TaxID=90970 RepID=A0ABT9LVL9_9BACL|nr:N-acetyl-gamma-glutamyl-phosphate reductase [Alicyclobacillus tengchongensis]MDP9728313.1 N-acetyl-gamma-glutamyl-phosphate reductase [Alicyclobacillus tengchongensis]
MNQPRIGVVGATGYAGVELIRILSRHPLLKITYLAAQKLEQSETYGHKISAFRQFGELPALEPFDLERCLDLCDLVFLALPSGISGRLALQIHHAGKKVIDLSGDLRLPKEVYESWYGLASPLTQKDTHAVYGLSDWQAEQIANQSLISNPGCYATAALLSLLPICQTKLVESQSVWVVDAKSGSTGAGKSPQPHLLLSELSNNFYPYRVGCHQHTPEIEQKLQEESKQADLQIQLTTQLLPIPRGILVSAYIPLCSTVSFTDLYEIYQNAYHDTPFVSILPCGEWPQIQSVLGANTCHIALHVDNRTQMLQIFAVIDNLQKGAAGQAVQNMNLMLGWPMETGLSLIGSAP